MKVKLCREPELMSTLQGSVREANTQQDEFPEIPRADMDLEKVIWGSYER